MAVTSRRATSAWPTPRPAGGSSSRYVSTPRAVVAPGSCWKSAPSPTSSPAISTRARVPQGTHVSHATLPQASSRAYQYGEGFRNWSTPSPVPASEASAATRGPRGQSNTSSSKACTKAAATSG